MKCIDLYAWYPARKHARNREPTRPVIGITNYDYCTKKYWLIGEVDHKYIDLDKVKPLCYMIVETAKGYHLYFKEWCDNPLTVIHYAIKKYKFLDKHHLYMGLRRYRKTGNKKNAFLVLRVSPKYREPDLRIIYFDDNAPEWFRQVKKLITFLNQPLITFLNS